MRNEIWTRLRLWWHFLWCDLCCIYPERKILMRATCPTFQQILERYEKNRRRSKCLDCGEHKPARLEVSNGLAVEGKVCEDCAPRWIA